MGRPARPPPPHQPAPIFINLRGLVFNFAKKSFCGSFFFLLRIFFSRTKTFIDIDLKINCILLLGYQEAGGSDSSNSVQLKFEKHKMLIVDQKKKNVKS
jgi:hypothetical protein